MMGRLVWKEHHNMFNENIYHVMNGIMKPFNMGILGYAERVHKMFEMDKLIPPPSKKNEEQEE